MRIKLVLPLSMVVAAIVSAAAVADSAAEKQKSIQNGAAHYRIFCINCHGSGMDGNGPLTELLKIRPADLTVLGQTLKSGESVSTRVLNAVDGRHQVGSGQERKMPTFNDNLEVRTVIEIAAFIEAIQK